MVNGTCGMCNCDNFELPTKASMMPASDNTDGVAIGLSIPWQLEELESATGMAVADEIIKKKTRVPIHLTSE